MLKSQVIIVDDGSSDCTSKIALEQVKKHTVDILRVIILGRNQKERGSNATRAAAQKLFTNMRLKRLSFQFRWCCDVELVYLCKCLNISILDMSVRWTENPGSKVHMSSIMHMLIELMLVRVGYGLGFWKFLKWVLFALAQKKWKIILNTGKSEFCEG
ncbi:Dolichyl-phosphate beta-glucosyltransferase [Nymphaea thermarum]|nr:Dolichyl-phosphate beta-glucosyltransferase [Nymphaea thermarum]